MVFSCTSEDLGQTGGELQVLVLLCPWKMGSILDLSLREFRKIFNPQNDKGLTYSLPLGPSSLRCPHEVDGET